MWSSSFQQHVKLEAQAALGHVWGCWLCPQTVMQETDQEMMKLLLQLPGQECPECPVVMMPLFSS